MPSPCLLRGGLVAPPRVEKACIVMELLVGGGGEGGEIIANRERERDTLSSPQRKHV